MNIDVSIVMPVHNGENFVAAAINSVLAQTFKNFEVIVVDDGSTDSSLEIIKHFSSLDSRVRLLVRGKASGGPAVPRNLGLDMAQGKYVAFLDCDDLWYPGKLDRQISFMREKKAVISYTAYQRIDENGKQLQKVRVPESMSYQELLLNTAIATSSTMLDRSIAGNERFHQQGHEDYAFWLGILKRHGRCFGLNEELIKYRIVSGSVSSRKLKSVLWVWRIYRQNEGLSLPYAIWCLANYGFRAIVKRMR